MRESAERATGQSREEELLRTSSKEGSLWELIAFAVFFVLVFSAVARAEEPGKSDLSNYSRSGKSLHAVSAAPKTSTSLSPSRTRGYLKSSSGNGTLPASAAHALSTRMKRKTSESPFGFSGALYIENNQTLDSASSKTYAGYYILSLITKYKPWDVGVSGIFGFWQEYTTPDNEGDYGTMDDPIMVVTKTFRSGRDYSTKFFDTVSFGLRGSVPGNKYSRRAGQEGTVGGLITGTKTLGSFTFATQFRYIRAFFEKEYVETNDSRKVNAPDQTRARLDLSYAFTEKLSWVSSFAYLYFRSFEGVPWGVEIFQSTLAYSLLDNVSLAAGVSNERGTLDSEGNERIRVYDQKTARALVGLTLSF